MNKVSIKEYAKILFSLCFNEYYLENEIDDDIEEVKNALSEKQKKTVTREQIAYNISILRIVSMYIFMSLQIDDEDLCGDVKNEFNNLLQLYFKKDDDNIDLYNGSMADVLVYQKSFDGYTYGQVWKLAGQTFSEQFNDSNNMLNAKGEELFRSLIFATQRSFNKFELVPSY